MKLSAGARRFLLLTVLHMVLQCSHSHMASAQPHLPLAMSDPESVQSPSAPHKHSRHGTGGQHHNGDHSHAVRHRNSHHLQQTDPEPESDSSQHIEYDYDGGDLLPRPGTYIPSNCSSCIRREELRKRNLEVIKDQILIKLGMISAPNMTGRHPPRIPPLDHLLDRYGMQGDAPQKGFQTGPVLDEEDDDFHARTEKVIAFAQARKSQFTSFFLFENVVCSVLNVAKCLLYTVMTFAIHKNKKDASMI